MARNIATDTFCDDDFGDEALDRSEGERMCTGIGINKA